MWIQVRSMDGLTHHGVSGLSKLTKVETLKQMLEGKFEASADRIRLFFRGKQLEDGNTLFDYDVSINDVVQVLVKPLVTGGPTKEVTVDLNKPCTSVPNRDADNKPSTHTHTSVPNRDADKENQPTTSLGYPPQSEESVESRYYKVGDVIDGIEPDLGAWFEGRIVRIQKKSSVLDQNAECSNTAHHGRNESTDDSGCVIDDGLEYHIIFYGYEKGGIVKLQLKDFRPRMCRKIGFDDVKENSRVIVNYSLSNPEQHGFYYDCIVKGKDQFEVLKEAQTVITKDDGETKEITEMRTEIVRQLTVNLILGHDEAEIENCRIVFVDDVYEIEKHKLLIDRENVAETSESPFVRLMKLNCLYCRDVPTRKCTHCGCRICGGKEDPDKQLLCDECDYPYHIGCLKPPLTEVPSEDEWYCPGCKNDSTEVVHAGEKLKESKKKAKMASATSSSNRDWGKGMACVGRTKECTLVPRNHFGPIPGVEVGTLWKFRVQVSESGVHRPHVAGIHGRENDGAYSIVLSGGYEDDLDDGGEFNYTGSGGRDLSGNKRTAEQSYDQTLTRMNRALALNCAAPINSEVGAEAKNWKDGKPVRVVRNSKGSKHSEYSPEEGCRYDGIYKVVRYWPEKGKSGYLVWRYLLRRDDPIPAPWTKAGKKRTKELGLTMQYPEGYLESRVKNKGKRPIDDDDQDKEKSSSKKAKAVAAYVISPDIEKLIAKDQNQKLWDECKKSAAGGSKAFFKKVEELFSCICCQEVVYKPITTECLHNICLSCMSRSFKAGVFTCPMCRHNLGADCSLNVNKTLQCVLLKFFPGYDAGR